MKQAKEALKKQQEQFDETVEEAKTVKGLTAKEIKNLVKPVFQKNPENFYPTKVFEHLGFHRHQCPKCNCYYWRRTTTRDTCGDSGCVGTYQFIGRGTGIGRKGQYLSYSGAWESFKKSLTSARVPCHAIERYPVVARWRNDVDYVAAGIYCFQPYCVTGELEPPANPLICPQFSVRFNDLDNIGLTGRHYSGFIMLGIQVFNYPDKYVFFKEECVEFNYRWLVDELGVDPDEITFIEDVWSGGGNLGPSVEYFVGGLEIGNMVFMQYKYFPDGSYEELPIKIIDTGIGLERIPWLINGTPTSYCDVFHNALGYLCTKLGMSINNDVWAKLGPFTCQLNIDEVENIDKTWEQISQTISTDLDVIRKEIQPVKELYIVLDHTRTVLMIVYDGSLPSNVGGGSNVRNILRRVFALLKKNGWWDKLQMEGLIQLFEHHKKDLSPIYGEFKEYKSFEAIIRLEYDRWFKTDDSQKSKLDKILKKSQKLSLDDWISAMQTHGIPADAIAEISGQPVPPNLYIEIATRAERITKAAELVLYNTVHLPETENLYYKDHKQSQFSGKIVDIFNNVQQANTLNIVILDQSLFYPSSGGQSNDKGWLTIENEKFEVVNCEKVGHCVLHILDRPLPQQDKSLYIGKEVQGQVDMERRTILRNHHTATHIVFAACRRVLGPHVWQNGAKKTVENAHLDITHFQSLTKEQEQEIENEANKIILSARSISKGFMNKSEAEKTYGFRLYQGGVVPGNNLRVVNIDETDVEACCGTHCDNTSEVGWVKILKTSRIQDGVLRLYYVAGTVTIDVLNKETELINSLVKLWGVSKGHVVEEASKIFKQMKAYQNESLVMKLVSFQYDHKALKASLIQAQMRWVIDGIHQLVYIQSQEDNPTNYFSELGKYVQELQVHKFPLILQAKNKGVIYIGDNFVYGMLGTPQLADADSLHAAIKEGDLKLNKQNKLSLKEGKVMNILKHSPHKKTTQVQGILVISMIGKFNRQKALEWLDANKFFHAKI